jgi:CheY-like chemotaxis protein
MQLQAAVQEVVLVWVRDPEVLEVVRDFLEPLGYAVEFAPEAAAPGETAH